MNFQDYIRSCREKAKLTQESAAEKIGVSVTTIANWESGRNKPEYTTLNKIIETYSISGQDLLYKLSDFSKEENTENINLLNIYEKYLPETKFRRNANLESLKKLTLNKDEQELFLKIALNYTAYYDTAVCITFNDYDIINLHSLIKSLEEKELIDRNHWAVLSSLGEAVFSYLRKTNFVLFDAQSIPGLDFVKLGIKADVFEYCNTGLFDKIINVYKNNEIILNDEYKHIIKEYPDLFNVEKRESTEDKYLIEKEVYLKQLDLYNENKDKVPGLKEPKFTIENHTYISLSERGIELAKSL